MFKNRKKKKSVLGLFPSAFAVTFEQVFTQATGLVSLFLTLNMQLSPGNIDDWQYSANYQKKNC